MSLDPHGIIWQSKLTGLMSNVLILKIRILRFSRNPVTPTGPLTCRWHSQDCNWFSDPQTDDFFSLCHFWTQLQSSKTIKIVKTKTIFCLSARRCSIPKLTQIQCRETSTCPGGEEVFTLHPERLKNTRLH